MAINLNNLLLASLNRSWKIEQVKSAVIFDSIIKCFLEKKSFDIKDYLISVKLIWNNLSIKTNKPIINSEIITIEDYLKNQIILKLNKIWIKQKEIKIIYK